MPHVKKTNAACQPNLGVQKKSSNEEQTGSCNSCQLLRSLPKVLRIFESGATMFEHLKNDTLKSAVKVVSTTSTNLNTKFSGIKKEDQFRPESRKKVSTTSLQIIK